MPAVVAKFPTQNAGNSAVAQGFLMREREVRFFRELAQTVGDVALRFYYSAVSHPPATSSCSSEDMSDYRAGDQQHGCALQDAELALDAVARLHAGTWDAPARRELDVWPRSDGPVHLSGFGCGCRRGTGAGARHLLFRRRARCRQRQRALQGRHPGAARPHAAGTPVADPRRLPYRQPHARPSAGSATLRHARLPEPDRHEVRPRRGLPALTEPEHGLRRAEECRLVGGYHTALIRQGVTGYAAEACWEDYRLAVLHCFESAVVIAGTHDPANDCGRAWIERPCSARARPSSTWTCWRCCPSAHTP